MSSINKPNTNFSISTLKSVQENAPQRILFVGQQDGGTSTSGVLVKNIGSDGQENSLFGERSMLSTMIRDFRAINSISQVDAIPLDDNPSSTQAVGVIEFGAGTVTKTTTITIYIQSKNKFRFDLVASIGDTAPSLSSKLADLINANSKILVTANGTSDPGTTNIISSFTGEEANNITIEIQGSIPTNPITLTQMNGGAGSPDVSSIFNQIESIRYQTIVYPASYDKSTIVNFLNNRFNNNQNLVLDGVAFSCETDTASNLIAIAQPLNSQCYVLIGNKPQSVANKYAGSSLFEFNPSIASQFAAIRTLRLTPNANISDYLSSNNVTSTFGGPWLAAVPYASTPFYNLSTIEEEYGWTFAEQQSLADGGVAILGNNVARNTIIASDIVTTYLTSASGNDDLGYKYLNYVDTYSTCREFFVNNNRQKYVQTTLSLGTKVPGSRIVTKADIFSYQVLLYEYLSRRDANNVLYSLVPAGREAYDNFKKSLVVELFMSTGLVSITSIIPINTQIREIQGSLFFSFNFNVGS